MSNHPFSAAAILVSVVIPAYNAQRTLGRAISSAAAQSFPPLEIIVVDDGSTDASSHIAGTFPSVTRISTRHSGPAKARNTGLASAAGEWIAFLDADDQWHTQKLERIAALLSADPEVTVAYSDAIRVVDGVPTRRWSEDARPCAGNVLADILVANCVCQSTVVVRRDALLRVGGYDESFAAWEDIDLWLRLARTERFGYAPEVLVDYHMSGCSLSTRADAMATGHFRSVEQALRWPEVLALPSSVRRHATAATSLHLSEAYYLNGQGDLARRFLRRAVRQRPSYFARASLARMYLQSYLPANFRSYLRASRHRSPSSGAHHPTQGI